MTEFTRRIYEVVKQIPKGRVASYGQVAQLAGNPRGARGVGFALHRNPEPGVIPCHQHLHRLCLRRARSAAPHAGGRGRPLSAGRPRGHGCLPLAVSAPWGMFARQKKRPPLCPLAGRKQRGRRQGCEEGKKKTPRNVNSTGEAAGFTLQKRYLKPAQHHHSQKQKEFDHKSRPNLVRKAVVKKTSAKTLFPERTPHNPLKHCHSNEKDFFPHSAL